MADPPSIPYFAESVPAGFPSPAVGDLNGTLDLNQLCIRHHAATYFVRARGNSMIQAGIDDGDILVVDRSLTPQSGSIVIAAIAGEFTVKQLELTKDKARLLPANPDYSPIALQPGDLANLFGVVTFVIRQLA